MIVNGFYFVFSPTGHNFPIKSTSKCSTKLKFNIKQPVQRPLIGHAPIIYAYSNVPKDNKCFFNIVSIENNRTQALTYAHNKFCKKKKDKAEVTKNIMNVRQRD